METTKNQLIHEINAATHGSLDSLVLDGSIKRFSTGNKGHNDNGWYVGDELGNGHWRCTYGCWKQGIQFTSHSYNGNAKTQRDRLHSEYAQQAEQQRKERAKAQEKAASKAESIWGYAHQDTSPSEYLKHKQVDSHGIRWNHQFQNLVIPIYNAEGKITSLQYIYNDGRKRFLEHGAKAGGFFVIGNPESADIIYLAEGYATAATIHECTGMAVVVAFDAGNLDPVTGIFRKQYPDRTIVIAADNDRFTTGNPGITKAKAAAIQHDGILAVPAFKHPTTGTDYNDLRQQEGSQAVLDSLLKATKVDSEQEPELDFSGHYDTHLELLKALKDSPYKVKAAKECLKRHFGLVPHKYELETLLCNITMPLELNSEERSEVEQFGRWLYDMTQRRHLEDVTLTIKPDYTDLSEGVAAFIEAYRENPDKEWLVVIKAPHGAGKNQICIKQSLLGIELKSLLVNHRQSLCRDAAGNLGLQSYQDDNIDPLESLVCCVNSLPGMMDYTRGTKMLYADEVTQVLREVLNRDGTVAKSGHGIEKTLDELAHLTSRSKVCFLLDADLDDWTVEVLRKFAPNKELFVINKPFERQDRTVHYDSESSVLGTLQSYLDEGLNIWVSTNNAQLAATIKELVLKHGGKPTLIAKTPIDTTGEPEVYELLTDINGNIHQHEIVITTPVISSGVSITKEHFDKHFFFYSGDSVTPADFHQMMLRDRTWKDCYLGIKQQYGTFITADELLNREQAAAEYEADVLKRKSTFSREDELTQLIAQRDAKEKRMKANPAQALLMILEARGYTINKLNDGAFSGKELKQLRKLTKEDYIERVKNAGTVTDMDYRDIHRKVRKTPEESAKLEAYKIHQCFNLQPWMVLTDEHFDLWEFGKLESQQKNFKRLVSDADEDKPLQKATFKLLQRAGIDFETGAGTVTQESALEAWKLMSKCKDGDYLAKEGFTVFRKNKPQRPITWLSDFLDHFGLDLDGKQVRKDGTVAGNSYYGNNVPTVPTSNTPNPPLVRRGQRVYTLNSVRVFSDEIWLLESHIGLLNQSYPQAQNQAMRVMRLWLMKNFRRKHWLRKLALSQSEPSKTCFPRWGGYTSMN